MKLLLLFALTVIVFGEKDLKDQSDEKQIFTMVVEVEMKRICESKSESMSKALAACLEGVPPKALHVIFDCAGGRHLNNSDVMLEALDSVCDEKVPEGHFNQFIYCVKNGLKKDDVREVVVAHLSKMQLARNCVEEILKVPI